MWWDFFYSQIIFFHSQIIFFYSQIIFFYSQDYVFFLLSIFFVFFFTLSSGQKSGPEEVHITVVTVVDSNVSGRRNRNNININSIQQDRKHD